MRGLAFLLLCVGALGLQLDIHVVVPRVVAFQTRAIAATLPHNLISFRVADPHVTLYLTDFPASQVKAVVRTLREIIPSFASSKVRVNLTSIQVSGNYTLWNDLSNGAGLRALSDYVVSRLSQLATPNQTVPSWVYSLPEPERSRKIAMVKKYGSPNVFSEFDPHVTLAYDTKDNVTAILHKHYPTAPKAQFVAEAVAVSKVGPYGTVLRTGELERLTLPVHAQASGMAQRKDFSWDFFLLVREWPGTIAKMALPSYVQTFTVHGLWPQRNDNTWPSFCNDSYHYEFREIASIYKALDVAWFDTMYGHVNGSSFWSHEWEKHGTCAALGAPGCCGSEIKFFKSAIALHDQITEVAWLEAAGIVPADPTQTTYPTDSFVSAMSQQLGQQVMIKCSKDRNGVAVINNFGVCIAKDLSVMACPDILVQQWAKAARCGAQIGFPPIPH